MFTVSILLTWAFHSLQDVSGQREQVTRDLARLQARLTECEEWLTQAKIAHSGEPMAGYDVTYLRQQLKENQVRTAVYITMENCPFLLVLAAAIP